jgi:hypothetical protein
MFDQRPDASHGVLGADERDAPGICGARKSRAQFYFAMRRTIIELEASDG